MQYPQPNPPFSPQSMQPREKRQHGAIAALILSFFSAGLYRDVARRWRGIGFWYLVLLMLLTSIPEAIKVQLGMHAFVKNDLTATLATFPTITVDDKHEASIAESDPYIWSDPKTNQALLYVDTAGVFDVPAGANAPVKLSKTQIIVRKNAMETQTYNLSQLPPFSVDKTKLANWADIASHYVGVFMFGIGLIFGTLGHLIQILIYALFGLIFCAMFSVKLDYAALLRLSAVAITPAVILGMVLTVAGINLPFEGWLFFVLEMLVLALAVKANAADQPMPPTGFPMAAYPPGYGATAGGYPQQPYGHGGPQQVPAPGYGIPPQQFPPGGPVR